MPFLNCQNRAKNSECVPDGVQLRYAIASIMRTAARPTGCISLGGLTKFVSRMRKDPETAAPCEPTIKKWEKFTVVDDKQPMFRFRSGVPLTGKKFNEIVRGCLAGEVEGVEKLFCSHSFRAGAASMMAAIGYSDDEIKAVGRWSSRAFMEYIKLPRTQRAEIAQRISRG